MNFKNQAFEEIYEGITRNMPSITFFGIVGTYLITAALNIYFIPLPFIISIPAALAIQFGRFAVVFMDFLNPTGVRSPWPPIIATLATVIALVELGFSIGDMQAVESWTDTRYWSIFLFGGMLVSFGYILELNFIAKGAEAFGMTSRKTASGATGANRQSQPVKAPHTNGQKTTEEVFFELGLNGNGKHS